MMMRDYHASTGRLFHGYFKAIHLLFVSLFLLIAVQSRITIQLVQVKTTSPAKIKIQQTSTKLQKTSIVHQKMRFLVNKNMPSVQRDMHLKNVILVLRQTQCIAVIESLR